MEKVPDMDALLDELEEAVAGSRRKHSKISETGAEQAVVIELPVHLRKLSEKVTTRETREITRSFGIRDVSKFI